MTRDVDGGRRPRGIGGGRNGLLVVAASLFALVFATAAFAAVGDVSQKAGTDGCVSETGTGGSCRDGTALDGVQWIAVSPDGKSAYGASAISDAVVILDRDPTTGKLTQKSGTDGCISETGSLGLCRDGTALDGIQAVAVSPDGKSAYAVSTTSDAIVVFDRDLTTGKLTQKAGADGCISESGSAGACRDGMALNSARSVAVSPDGKSIYVGSTGSDAVAIFDRDPATGKLTQKPGTDGCISETGTRGSCRDGVALDGAQSVAVSADGKSAYVASAIGDAIAIFDRDATTGRLTQKPGTDGCISETGSLGLCRDGVALDNAQAVAVSPDGKSAYVASAISDAITVFDRDPTTGKLTSKSGTDRCASETGTSGACSDRVALNGARAITVSPDGKSVYAASAISDAIAIFDRDPTTGRLTQRPGAFGCISETGSGGTCNDRVALNGARSVAVSPDGKNVYAASSVSDAIPVFNRSDGTVLPNSGCDLDPATLTVSGCSLLFDDTAKVSSAGSLWGSVDCQTASRHSLIDNGDTHRTGIGDIQTGAGARQLTVLDGDNFWGERCELGKNSRTATPMPLYDEGDHKVTFVSYRLPDNYPLSTDSWQLVMQMKQTQPAANGSGTPVLSMRASKGRWSLWQSDSPGASNSSTKLWSTPATANRWTRFAFDVNYSQDPARGSITVYVDLNGDGDALDSGEISPVFNTYTLKVETSGGDSGDGVAPGESISSHLRIGIYHAVGIDCPSSRGGCSTQVDNIQIAG